MVCPQSAGAQLLLKCLNCMLPVAQKISYSYGYDFGVCQYALQLHGLGDTAKTQKWFIKKLRYGE